MKTIIETKSGLCFDLDELAAVNIYGLKVVLWLKGISDMYVAGEFDDQKSAQAYRNELIKAWTGYNDEEGDG